jgi:hypothetical protein
LLPRVLLYCGRLLALHHSGTHSLQAVKASATQHKPQSAVAEKREKQGQTCMHCDCETQHDQQQRWQLPVMHERQQQLQPHAGNATAAGRSSNILHASTAAFLMLTAVVGAIESSQKLVVATGTACIAAQHHAWLIPDVAASPAERITITAPTAAAVSTTVAAAAA